MQGKPRCKFEEDFSSHCRDPNQQIFAKISLFFFFNFCFFLFFFSISNNLQNRYNLHMHVLIWLKFGTRIGNLKANTRINFGVNLINIEEVISNFMHKAKSNLCLVAVLNIL